MVAPTVSPNEGYSRRVSADRGRRTSSEYRPRSPITDHLDSTRAAGPSPRPPPNPPNFSWRLSAAPHGRPVFALLAWPCHADFSEPRSRPRCCLSALRWPLITYGEEASPDHHFGAGNIHPAAVATGSIITSSKALAAADSGRPPYPGLSLSRLRRQLRQPITIN